MTWGIQGVITEARMVGKATRGNRYTQLITGSTRFVKCCN